LRLIDFLTIDASSENLVCGTIWNFLGIVSYETILSDADWIINTSSSKSAQFIYLFFLTLVCFTGFSSVLVKLPPFSVKEEDRLYFPIIQGTS
jgi:hypothetical protein